VVKELNVIFIPHLRSWDITVVRLRINLYEGRFKNVLRSVYMPYDSKDLLPQEIVKELVIYAEEKGLELLLDCDSNSHHRMGKHEY